METAPTKEQVNYRAGLAEACCEWCIHHINSRGRSADCEVLSRHTADEMVCDKFKKR